ncbi:MAG: hypothetical protein IJ548_03455 [Paludibacteraceae bacterium]|nr:hypothetical protein [Paludibacteraceae bacterium]MBQ8705341.1 hypothetical protein [Paludibacteraceae bacterium]
MTHFHYFIKTPGRILDDQSRLYIVGVGSSKQAGRDYLFLTAYAAEHECYFSPITGDADAFIHRCEQSIGYPLRMRSQRISARCLVRSLKAGSDIPYSADQLRNVDHLRKFLSLNYRIVSNLRQSSPA